jgi:hypothetical protein
MSRAVSPELVLVDPDLARAERERLVEGARLALIVAETRVAASAPTTTAALPRPRWREALVPGIAVVSLAANIVLASLFVARGIDGASSPTAVRVGTSSVDRAATTARTSRARTRVVPAGRAEASAAERHVFAWLVRTPASSLPKALAGAGRPGGQTLGVLCVARAPKSYRCSLRVGGKRLHRTLLVEYPAPAEGGARIEWAP